MKRVLSSILILLIGISAIAQNNKYSVGRLSGTVNVGELGNAIYSLPIEIPEGLSNINPNVSICYNSFSGYGDLGMGFYIDGLSEISRTNKNLFFDGVSDVIDYKNGPDFLLDGKRLIKIANNKYTVENELSAVVEYFKDGNYFELKKDGKTYRYHTEIFRLDGTATWNLWQVTDNFGNTIKYSYQGRIVNINVNNTYDIVFDYEFYENHIYSSRFGKQREITTCLKQVNIKQQAKNLRSYDIEYVERNGFRYISSITLKNAYGESLPPIKYEWDTEESYIKVEDVYVSNQSQSEYSNEIDFYEQLVLAGDINGDGLDDIILISPQYTSNFNRIMFYTTSVYNGKVYFNYTSHLNIPGSVDVGKITKKNSFFFADYDGNGVKELVVSHLQDAAGKFKNIIIAFIENGEEKHSFGFHLGSSEMPKIVGADFKNNGKSQIFCIETKKQDGVYPVQMFSIDDEQTLSLTLSGDPKEIFASDFNSDNAADIIIFTDKSYTIFYNNGDGTFSDNNKVENENCIDGFYIMHNGDFNGDGLMDFLYTETDNKTWYFLINRGDNEEFFKTTAWTSDFYDRSFTEHDNQRFDLHIFDFDLDGKTDVFATRAQYHKDDDMWYSPWGVYDITQSYWLRSGDHHLLNETKLSQSSYEDDALMSNFAVGDFNGDGVPELLNYGYDCYYGNKNDAHNPKWHIYFNTNINPCTKKIISVSDIYGTTKFNYSFLTDKYFYKKGNKCEYPMLDVVASLAVVSSTEEINGVTENIIKKYKYYDLTANVQGKGLLGFNKIECENLYTGENTTTEINSWNTNYYTPEKITQTVKRDTLVTKTETEFSITNLGGKNFISFPSKIKETDIYGDEVVAQNTFNTIHGYLENTITYYPDGFFKQQLSTGFVKAGGIWQPQVVINYQMIPESKVTSITKQYQEYDAATGTVVKKIENYGTDKQLTTEYTYDEFGNLIHTDAYSDGTENFSTDFTYESQKLIQTAHSNPKSIIKYAYDEYGRLISETDITNEANPLKTSFKYDGWGHLLKTTNPDGTFSATEYGWGDSKELFYYEFTRQTAAAWQKQWYDILGRKTLTETVGEGGVKIKINNTYDKFSNIINTKTLYGDTEFNDSYAYDNQNRITEHIGKNGSVTKYTYTKNSVTTETDGRKVVKKYDVFGNLLSTDDGIATIAYTYNSDCKPVAINAAGAEYSLQYDDVGNRTQLSDPDAGITKYEY
ncbi:MAG: VCBS repeat-containing protein, partial [Bacteroidales bacterium]|nr:VCBS repeat-containing protein [Bacteroidales bacterium]